jgi:hypothetical protein
MRTAMAQRSENIPRTRWTATWTAQRQCRECEEEEEVLEVLTEWKGRRAFEWM